MLNFQTLINIKPKWDQDGSEQLLQLRSGGGVVVLPAHGSEDDTHHSQDDSRDMVYHYLPCINGKMDISTQLISAGLVN